jgi:hypothetical protein
MKINYLILLWTVGILINFSTLEITKAKIISFLKKNEMDPEKVLEEYNKFLDKITVGKTTNQIYFRHVKIYKSLTCQAYLKNKLEIEEGGLKLYSIPNKYVINLKRLHEESTYDKFYSKIYDQGKVNYNSDRKRIGFVSFSRN